MTTRAFGACAPSGRRLRACLIIGAVLALNAPAPFGPHIARAQHSALEPRDPDAPRIPLPSEIVGPPLPTIEEVYPPTVFGKRLLAMAKKARTLPVLVLVPDEPSYLEAVSAWRVADDGVETRFPVLIDDGAYASGQRIARFTRAFAPSRVVRFKSRAPAFPPADKPVERRAALEAALAAVWGAAGPAPAQLKERFDTLGHTPPGAVIAWPTDPAWTAALALAAAHGQPFLWMEPRVGQLDGWISVQDFETFARQLAEQIESLGYSWKELGDDIDALSLCESLPVKVFLGETLPNNQKMRATTDLLGRSALLIRKQALWTRWAWSAQIAGSAPSAAYDAMCALFLKWLDRPWLLDGYNTSNPWVAFDMTTTGKILSLAGSDTLVDDATSGVGLDDLRRRAGGARMGSKRAFGDSAPGMGVDATFVAFNTKGNTDFFELRPGLARPIDAPLMRRPFAEYFVHSWSAAAPGARSTVGGVWRERGAFAYIGSVEEPTLMAFLPTPSVARRLTGNVPWGALVRPDDDAPADPSHPDTPQQAMLREPGKIAILGDPLMIKDGAPTRADGDPPLEGLEDVAATLPALLKNKDYAPALRTLTLLGRDTDAQRLLGTLVRADPAAVTPDIALAGVGAAFFTGDYETLIAAIRIIQPILDDRPRVEREGLAEIRDMLWHATWPLRSMLSADEADLVIHNLRTDNLLRDTEEAAWIADRFGGQIGTRRDVVDRARGLTKDEKLKEELRKLAR